MPFGFLSGNAQEFRVAAVNKNGSGEFLYVTPYHVVQGILYIQLNSFIFLINELCTKVCIKFLPRFNNTILFSNKYITFANLCN